MIKSRLRMRRVTKTVSVKEKTLASGQYSEADGSGLTGLTATWEPISGDEELTEAGKIVIPTDVFWFEPAVGGSLPAITENHVLVAGGVRYEVVMRPENQAGGGNRLKVMTRRVSD